MNFREFLAAEHAEENLLFWQDAELYRLIDPMASSGSRKPRTHSEPEVESAQMREYRGSFIAGSKVCDNRTCRQSTQVLRVLQQWSSNPSLNTHMKTCTTILLEMQSTMSSKYMIYLLTNILRSFLPSHYSWPTS
jgi:hypothetical protein